MVRYVAPFIAGLTKENRFGTNFNLDARHNTDVQEKGI